MNSIIQKDIDKFIQLYPQFFILRSSNERIDLKGIIDIVDVQGNYWDNYEVKIVVPTHKYPNIIPQVYELSTKIIRESDWHISKNGECCLDITHKLLLLQKKGINLISFYQTKIYPFFTNHTYKLNTGEYADGDYPHEFEGIKIFYKNEIGLNDIELIIKILTAITQNKLPSKTAICLCGQNKFKHCHLPIVTSLIQYGMQRLKEDLLFFKINYSSSLVL